MKESYRFRFYRTIVDGTGRPCHSTVETVVIRRARTPERAQQAAILRFIRHQRLSNWDSLASGYEVTGSQRRAITEMSP